MTPDLHTARLTLRGPRDADEADIVAAINDLEVSRWLTVVPYPYTPEDAQWFIGECLSGRERSWAITRTDEDRVLGMIGGRDSFGYWLRREEWGNGILSEAAPAVVAHIFEQDTPGQIRSEYFLGNARSAAVLYRLGFKDTDQREVTCRATGELVRSQQVALSRADWRPPSPAAS
ncbi:GNAT family N-acetyltransferase [Salibaculum griseiflavum]|uniref:N-acetyltransferase n=1 Tax=Salibaculum griseiflavum TaxID=1914409 RepID=A0A2V1P030_9RHOB|nr:GNAT family N-acetyltransferase [Salibaculum griseiflavum]PWG15921.1 N-acetyltransferase [Salibaculum griseiflavum]